MPRMTRSSKPLSARPDSQELGVRAEDRALAYLTGCGLLLVARNVRFRCGEIDLIMRDGTTLVFVEVRYRTNSTWGGAAESVDTRKQMRLIRAAQSYLIAHPGAARMPCRFDVVLLNQRDPPDWRRNAFETP